ncbi:MAG TPA: hypothetical protein PK250_13465 [Syntrophobacter fumaroxidans]|nr:hypothetical protein [Syntrophobacter fumaroxidans]
MKAVVAFFDDRFLQGFQVLSDLIPLEMMPLGLRTAVVFLFDHRHQGAAKDVAPYGLVTPVEDGARSQRRFFPEDGLDLPQLLGLQGGLTCGGNSPPGERIMRSPRESVTFESPRVALTCPITLSKFNPGGRVDQRSRIMDRF